MIFVRDKGQMCNNIIQFGHAYGWAREHGHRAISMRFGYKYRYFNICRTPGHNFTTYFTVKILATLRLIPDITYREYGCDRTREEERAAARKYWPTVISRWFVRHYDEFERHLPELRHLFSLLPEYEAVVERHWREAVPDGTRVIGLHIRRGDYAQFYDGLFLLSDDEYIAAAKATMALDPDTPHTIIICGNDPNLNTAKYQQELSEATVHISQGAPWEDLALFSRCHLLIGPPSSYTLVAAMHGKARLRWLRHGDTITAETEFAPFSTCLRTFDAYFPH